MRHPALSRGWVHLWQDRQLLIDARGQVIGCADQEDANETHIIMLTD